MSKSLGNMILPQTIADKNGAESCACGPRRRTSPKTCAWATTSSKPNVDAYRRLRNTIRFMLANLSGFDEKRTHRVHRRCRSWSATCSPSSRRLDAVWCARATRSTISTAFQHAVLVLHQRTVGVLFRYPQGRSLLRPPSARSRRRATRTVTDEVFRRVVTWLAPILCFTMEEAWLCASRATTKACICTPSPKRRTAGATTR